MDVAFVLAYEGYSSSLSLFVCYLFSYMIFNNTVVLFRSSAPTCLPPDLAPLRLLRHPFTGDRRRRRWEDELSTAETQRLVRLMNSGELKWRIRERSGGGDGVARTRAEAAPAARAQRCQGRPPLPLQGLMSKLFPLIFFHFPNFGFRVKWDFFDVSMLDILQFVAKKKKKEEIFFCEIDGEIWIEFFFF